MQSGELLANTYRILEPLGSGGIGTIYLAWHENLQKYVIVKKIKDHCTDLINCRGEVDILKGLRHMYLPQVYNFVEDQGSVYTVMDYIAGHDLKYYIDTGYPFDEEQLVIWLKQMLEVLAYLHGHGIIHCDIKPANIMITEEGNICLIDFNISLDGENNKELTGLSSQFASPEQLKKALYKISGGIGEDAAIDGRSDLYSLGAVMYYIMTGIRPNARRDDFIPIRYIGRDVNPYSDGLTNIVDKAMQENPSRRFKNAEEMYKAVSHMVMWGNEYKRLVRLGAGLDIAAFALGLLLVCMMIAGYRNLKADIFFSAYDAYMAEVETLYETLDDSGQSEPEASDTARHNISEGVRLLNESGYRNQFEDYPEVKADVLYGIARSALYLEDYAQARTYLADAVQYDQDNGFIYRDLAVASIYCGQRLAAEEAVADAVRCGIGESGIWLVDAERAYAGGDYEAAFLCALEAAKKAASESRYGLLADEEAWRIQQRSAMIAAAGAAQCGKLPECIDFAAETARQAAERGTDGTFERIFWLRKAAEMCTKAVDSGETGSKYEMSGIEYYETIRDSGYAGLTDLYNLAFLYEHTGQLTVCRDLLLEMERDWPETCETALRLAYIYYQIENNKAAKNRDYSQMIRYFEKAKALADASGQTWTEDAAMVQMNAIVADMTARGVTERR